MGRMESNKMDETQPTSPQPAGQPMDETRPVQTSGDSLAETAPMQVPSAPPSQDAPPFLPTQPVSVQPPEGPLVAPKRPKRSRAWVWWSLLGIFVMLMIALGSVYLGYQSAIQQRLGFQSTQVAAEAQAQFDQAVQDQLAGRYDLARQRFEYVMQMDPNFPGITEKLAEVMVAMISTATATVAPTPTLTPTPDTRGREELFTQAQASLLAGDWSTVIDTLLTLRKRDPTFMAVKVDGMIFVALRNRGVDKIASKADLEGGTYDLALAERFGPLDVEARNWRDWATLYVRGASFWDVDWAQAVYYFGQLVQIAPNLVDGSGYTAFERNILALLGYGDWFARQGKFCEAQQQYEAALSIRDDPVARPTIDFASQKCQEANAPVVTPVSQDTPTPTSTLEFIPVENTPTPTETQEVPTETPTSTPETPTPSP
jgi:tetratricopeptide (TPR) repeat protein